MGIAFVAKRVKKAEVSTKKKSYTVKNASLVSKGTVRAKDGMLFTCRCPGNEELDCRAHQRGSKFSEEHIYHAFCMRVSVKKLDELILYEISHNHIVPQTVCLRPKTPSVIKLSGIGYKIESFTGEKFGFILIGAKSVKLERDEISLSVGERTWIALSDKGIPTIGAVKKFISHERSPFSIHTADNVFDDFFNEWLWDGIEQVDEQSFDNAVALLSVRLCFTDEKCREYMKMIFFEADSLIKKALAICILCEYAKSYGDEIFDKKIEDDSLRDHINSYTLRQNIDSIDDVKAKLLWLSALYRYVEYAGESDTKLRLLNLIERCIEKEKLTYDEVEKAYDKYLYLYFISDPFAQRAYREDKKNFVSLVQEFNPLCGAERPNFITSALIYRAIVRDILGVRSVKGGFELSPCFPDGWERAIIRCGYDKRSLTAEIVAGSNARLNLTVRATKERTVKSF